MKTIPNVILLMGVSLLLGCGSSHRLESQLLRPSGVLSVGVRSDTEGEISATAGTTPRVTVLLGKKDEIIVEQAGNETLLRIRGNVWSRIPPESKRLEVRFKDQEFLVELDGVALPKGQDAERVGPANGSQPIRPETNQISSAAGSHR
jgi:hypothetical protein